MIYKNQSEINRELKDKLHPYTCISNCILKLNGYERSIMLELLSNSDKFIINKEVVMKRLEFPKQKFNDAWKSLEGKGHIKNERIQGGVKWIVYEKPNSITNIAIDDFITSIGGSTNGSTTNGRQLTSTKVNK